MRISLYEIQKDIKNNNWQKYAISSKWYLSTEKRELDAKKEMQRILVKLSGGQNG